MKHVLLLTFLGLVVIFLGCEPPATEDSPPQTATVEYKVSVFGGTISGVSYTDDTGSPVIVTPGGSAWSLTITIPEGTPLTLAASGTGVAAVPTVTVEILVNSVSVGTDTNTFGANVSHTL